MLSNFVDWLITLLLNLTRSPVIKKYCQW